MSSAGEAVIRAFFEAAEERDYDRISQLFDPESVWLGTSGGLDAHRVIRGPDAVVSYFKEVDELWLRMELKLERLIEGDGLIVAFMREIGQSGRGEMEMENETAAVFRIREGRILEVRGYLDRDEALREAGIPG